MYEHGKYNCKRNKKIRSHFSKIVEWKSRAYNDSLRRLEGKYRIKNKEYDVSQFTSFSTHQQLMTQH